RRRSRRSGAATAGRTSLSPAATAFRRAATRRDDPPRPAKKTAGRSTTHRRRRGRARRGEFGVRAFGPSSVSRDRLNPGQGSIYPAGGGRQAGQSSRAPPWETSGPRHRRGATLLTPPCGAVYDAFFDQHHEDSPVRARPVAVWSVLRSTPL